MKRLVWLTAIALWLQITPAFAVPKDFDPHHIPVIALGSYPPSLKAGTGIIEGYLKAKTQFFGELTYPNEDVLLLPNTEFSYWYIEDVAYMVENPYAKDALQNYPIDLVKYTRHINTDSNGFFRFSGLPNGSYIVWTAAEHEEDSEPTRERVQLAMGADGSMVSVPTFRKGLKIHSDSVVIAATANVGIGSSSSVQQIDKFDVVGEFTCCSAQI